MLSYQNDVIARLSIDVQTMCRSVVTYVLNPVTFHQTEIMQQKCV